MYNNNNKLCMIDCIGTPLKPLRTPNSRGSMEPLFPYPPDQLYSIPGTLTFNVNRMKTLIYFIKY